MKLIRFVAAAATVALCGLMSGYVAGAAVNPTSYITHNIAGANSTYGYNTLRRVYNAQLAVWYAAANNPSGIALQEVCTNYVNPSQTDAYQYLLWELTSRGYQSTIYFTKYLSSLQCRQGTMASGKGSLLGSDYRILPGTAEGETRVAVCIVTSAYVQIKNCSSHLTRNGTERDAQSYSYYSFVETYAPSFANWAGGDFNTDNWYQLYYWYNRYSEGDSLNRATNGSRKIDYSFGRLSLNQAAGGATVTGAGNYSDHNLILSPFNWVY